MAIQQACEHLAERRFELDCWEIRFERGGSYALSFKGPGNLWRNEDGSLRFKAHLSEADFLAAWRDKLRLSLPPGELVPDDFLFRSTALSYDGVTWKGTGWPGLSNLLSRVGTATGGVNELASEASEIPRDEITQERVWMYLPYTLNFPKVAVTHLQSLSRGDERAESIPYDHATFQVGNEKFTIGPHYVYC